MWYYSVYKAFIFAGIISFIIGGFTESNTSLGAYIAGYSVLILGISMILIILFSKVNNDPLKILYSAGPFILILAIISFILYLLIYYKTKIIEGHVAPGYNSFSNIIIILLLVQLYIIYNNINTDTFDQYGKISNITLSIIYLLSVLTGISTIILYTILKYYSTDGFSTINLSV